jgi:hypothetical protein
MMEPMPTSERTMIRYTEADGTLGTGELEILEEAPGDPDRIQITIRLPAFEKAAIAEDYFQALVDIRHELEKTGRRLLIQGASLKVYPSPMSRSMGAGLRAYKLTMGQPARTADLVNIFESGPDLEPCTVAEQEEFYRAWLESLKNGVTHITSPG